MSSQEEQAFDRDLCSRLLGELCNKTLTERDHHQLADLLTQYPEARRFYREYLMVHVKLTDLAAVDLHRGNGSLLACGTPEDGVVSVECCPAEEGSGFASRAFLGRHHDHLPRLKHRSLKWVLSLAALVGFVLTSLSVVRMDNRENIQGQYASSDRGEAQQGDSTAIASKADPPFYVAQITGLTSDVRWGRTSASREFLLRLRSGDCLEIESGILELTYFSGATVILRGPCVFVPTGASSGRLLSGELTGNVTTGDFVLTTPTAEVLDLGTEFGVSLDDAGSTSVCVFDGKVRVSRPSKEYGPNGSLLLMEGMAAQVDQIGRINTVTDLDAGGFVRSLPSTVQKGTSISLVNLFNGMHGNRFRLAGVIAPDTGESDCHPWLRSDGPGYSLSGGFQLTDWHPFIDGVFIPSSTGADIQIDSIGHTVDLPASTGRTWGPIWSRSRVDSATAIDSTEDYWGTGSLEEVVVRLERCHLGMIGAHSNVGVTFDLNTVRASFGKSLTEFTAGISNLNNAQKRKPDWAKLWRFSADFRVFVDGELRDSRLRFSREDGELSVKVELSAEDRFLTLVTTDAGEDEPHAHDSNDHVVVIDPVLRCAD